jgi:hypothetical protein
MAQRSQSKEARRTLAQSSTRALTEEMYYVYPVRQTQLMATVSVSRIRHHDQRVLFEIKIIEGNGERDFAALARQCSEDDASAAGGYLGPVAASALPFEIQRALGGARPGDVLGPIKQGEAWELYQLHDPGAPARGARDTRNVSASAFGAIDEVPSLDSPSAETWRRVRASARGPVLVRGVFDDCVALKRWNRAYLTAVAGRREVLVEYAVRRISRPDPRIVAGGPLRKTMSFADALAAIESPAGRGLTHYISALTIPRWLPELAADIGIRVPIDDRPPFSVYFFAGGDGTGTALHYDLSDNYLTVIEGEKDVLLMPPGGLKELMVTPLWLTFCGTSRLEPQQIEAYARGCAGAYRCRIRPGETLYVPRNWWHAIENRGLTFAVAYTYAWPFRSLLRWRQARLQIRYSLDAALDKRPALRRYADRLVESIARATAARAQSMSSA